MASIQCQNCGGSDVIKSRVIITGYNRHPKVSYYCTHCTDNRLDTRVLNASYLPNIVNLSAGNKVFMDGLIFNVPSTESEQDEVST